MDNLRIPKNQRVIHKIKYALKKAMAVFLVVCLAFLVSCIKKSATTSESSTLAASGISSVDETKRTSLAEETATTAVETSKSTQTTAKAVPSSSKKDKTTTKVSKASEVKKTAKKTTTTPAPKTTAKTTTPSTTANPNLKFCFLTIECKNVLKEENFNKLDSAEKSVIPSDGVILNKTKVEFNSGEKVYDVFKRVCQNNVCSHSCKYCQGRIHFESVPSAQGIYIRGIHYLYEKDCGTKSGWMYKVNGVFPEKAVDYYEVSENDDIVFVYTCNYNDV